ncbi:MAG: hypothetical protein ACKPFD_22335 [Dolichospermum sp.]
MESAVSRLALKIVVMTREQGTGKRFWATLLFVTYVGFFRLPNYQQICCKSSLKLKNFVPHEHGNCYIHIIRE